MAVEEIKTKNLAIRTVLTIVKEFARLTKAADSRQYFGRKTRQRKLSHKIKNGM